MFKGIHRSPSTGSDGELDYLMNLTVQDGELLTMPRMEETGLTMADGDRLMCVHIVGGSEDGHHFVAVSAQGNGIAWYDTDGNREVVEGTAGITPTSIKPMGNFLVVSTEDEPASYAIWRDREYQWLGSSLPQIDLQFCLRNVYVQSFRPGEETGITIESSGHTETTEFAQVVAPTPLTTPQFDEDTRFVITPSQPLARGVTYKVVTSRLTGTQSTPFTVTLRFSDNTEAYAAYSTAAHEEHPYALFTTPADKDVVEVVLSLWANGRQSKSLSVTLLKGTATDVGHVLADTPENLNALLGVANAFVDKYSRGENKFMFPFFVRYALRMYDGTYICPSPPCLMMPNRGVAPLIWTFGGTDGQAWDVYVSAVVSQLRYRLLNSSDLDRWKDLVTGLAIAVSSPVYTYNQGAEWKAGEGLVRLRRLDLSDEENPEDTWSYGWFDSGEGTCSATYLFNRHNSIQSQSREMYRICLPEFTNEQIEESVRAKAHFYIVKELGVDKLPSSDGWEDVPMDTGALEALETRRRIDDNPLTLNSRGGRVITVYNSRLVTGDVSEHLFQGYKPAQMQGMSGSQVNGAAGRTVVSGAKAVVTYADGGRSHRLCAIDQASRVNAAPLMWFYYPSAAAKRARVWQRDLTARWRCADLPLRSHPLLDGAFWFDNFNSAVWSEWRPYALLSDEEKEEVSMQERSAVVRSTSMICQSAVHNPFAVSAALSNHVGEGAVTALASSTHALSQGQFGQFPLYAFCTDGIWALSVAGDGTFASVQPVSRDCCANAASVVPTDRSVVFCTSQGLKAIYGSQVRLLSEALDGPAEGAELLRGVVREFDPLVVDEDKDLAHTLQSCTVAYDYPNHALHIFTPEGNGSGVALHYVLALSSGEFSLCSEAVQPDAVVGCWPDTLVQEGSRVMRFSAKRRADRLTKALVLTRPLDFGTAVGRKWLCDLRVLWRQRNTESSLRVALFGSNDRIHWWRLRSLNSLSCRWFRIALFASLSDHDRIEGILTSVNPK